MIAVIPFSSIDWAVVLLYFAAMLGLGLWFWKQNQSADQFIAGGRDLPGWLCGLSIFATYLSSISYLALPGKAFADNWNPFVFSLAIPVAAWVAVRFFVPLYRNAGEVSAYALLETRFGLWARIFASCFYLLFQVARVGVVMYLMALPMAVLFGWDMRRIIMVTGAVVIGYSFVGGILAVIWADAIQAVVLLGGALIALCILLLDLPGGLSQVTQVAAEDHKFSLGSSSLWALSEPTIWVVLAYGFFENLRNFGVDQSYIQRYIAAKNSQEAARSVWLAALLYVPVSALFFFIGTSLFAYYQTHTGDLDEVRRIVSEQKLLQAGVSINDADYSAKREQIAADLTNQDLGDRVFPHFIATKLPNGLRGLLIAAVFAAAMSTVSTSLNSAATLVMNDLYLRLLRPDASDKEQVRVLRTATVVWGLLGTGMALALVQVSSTMLDVWWLISSILGAGIIGLFLLGLLAPQVSRRQAVGILSFAMAVIAWMTLSNSDLWPEPLNAVASPFHPFLVIVIGPLLMIVLGRLAKSRP